jgi:hypothetical protein
MAETSAREQPSRGERRRLAATRIASLPVAVREIRNRTQLAGRSQIRAGVARYRDRHVLPGSARSWESDEEQRDGDRRCDGGGRPQGAASQLLDRGHEKTLPGIGTGFDAPRRGGE